MLELEKLLAKFYFILTSKINPSLDTFEFVILVLKTRHRYCGALLAYIQLISAIKCGTLKKYGYSFFHFRAVISDFEISQPENIKISVLTHVPTVRTPCSFCFNPCNAVMEPNLIHFKWGSGVNNINLSTVIETFFPIGKVLSS